MTGYGRGQGQSQGKQFTLEMKAVNHRFSEIVIRQPKQLSPLEDHLRKLIQAKVSRGRVDVFVSIEEYGETNKIVKVDKGLAKAYYSALKELGETLELPKNISLDFIARYPDVLSVEQQEDDLEEIKTAISQAAETAINQLIQMRETEGAKLKEDILNRLKKIEQANKDIAARAPLVVAEYKEKLANRIQEALQDVKMDEARLATEVAIFCDRSSIDEEIVRLNSHLEQMADSLSINESVGRKLDFIVQEMNREINTIGSKANDLNITSIVVEIKSEIEKIREQVQNIE